MLKIKLDERYTILGDKLNYILQERSARRNKDGEYTYNQIKFTATLESMFKIYMELSIRQSNAESIGEVLEVVKRIEKRIEEVLGGH